MPATRRNDQPHIPDYEWPEDADMTECGSCISLRARIEELEAQVERMKECARNNIGTYNPESDEAFERIANGCPRDAER